MADRAAAIRQIAEALEAGELTAREAAAELYQALVLPAAIFAERNAKIVEIRQRYYASHSDRAAANEIAVEWRRYAITGWRRGERTAVTCPAQHVGKLKGALWELMRIAPRPLKPETVRDIVGICDAPRAASR